ncbi:alpha-tubulin suppressor ATS1 and related RCC1 domain-containing protein [Acrasis kona]|uniref:Alpha-tubulin suppressor ATS1 and related RCC1 domain-containing protein n=1 Tax=Acrasis kona TaxID=1008807 RepID=A0AAW2ZBX1_9EUKA
MSIYVLGSNKNGQLALKADIENAPTITALVEKGDSPANLGTPGSSYSTPPLLSPSSPIQKPPYVLPLKFMESNINKVACEDRRVWVCGNNHFDQLGLDGFYSSIDEADCFELKELELLRNEKVVDVITRGLFTMFLTSDGNVWGCGHNEVFQLGLGHTQKVQHPINISLENADGLGSKQVKQVECGYEHTFFLTTDNEVWVCGANECGQLGLPKSVSEAHTPVKIDFFSENNLVVKEIACGGHHSVFILGMQHRSFTGN